ncbi:MAG TPA: hypothetical protein DCP08_08700 [Chloroflexi bacterium]|nr:hypothetical protein [Chloroflexota bacterium]
MREEIDELDLFLAWSMQDLVPDKDPPPRVWEAIEAKLAPGVSWGEVRPLPWRSKARAWLREALSSVQAVLLFLRFRLDEARVWAEEQPRPASVVISIYVVPWPLYCYREVTLHCWWSLTPTLR